MHVKTYHTKCHDIAEFLRLLEKQKASQLPLFFLFSPSFFPNNRELGAKKYFTDHWTADTTQLFVAIKGNFFWSILFLVAKGDSPDYLINKPTVYLHIIKTDIK